MMKQMKYVIGGALILGIAAGVWLGDLFKGVGAGNGVGIGQSGWSGPGTNESAPAVDLGVSAETAAGAAPVTLRVVIKDRSYYLRSGDSETPIDLEALVAMVQSATGDDDGIKLRIYKTETARVSAEMQLRDLLKNADVGESSIFTSQEIAE